MKISNEQLRALQEAETHRVKPHKMDEFGALFSRQLDAEQTQGVAPSDNTVALAPNLLSMPISGLLDDEAVPALQANAQEAAERMESMFSTVEQYAGELARNDKSDLREAYSLLERMNRQVAEFKSRFPNAGAEQPELAAMFNEIDVLATTETFKFNRGDYI